MKAKAASVVLAGGFRDDSWDWTLEKFYHHWFATDHEVLKLAEEIGVRDKIIFPRPKTSYWIDGKLYRSEISPSALFCRCRCWQRYASGWQARSSN